MARRRPARRRARPATSAGSRSRPTCSAASTAASGARTAARATARVDQRAEDGRALSFTSGRCSERIELLGNARVELELDSDRPVAQIAARLCDVAPDGSSLLVTRGVLNLTHRDSHEHPEPLEPGARTRVVVELDGIAQAVPAGHRLRLALSPAYWPWLWPVPEPVTLGIHTAPSALVLPVREPRAEDAELRPFGEPEGAPPLEVETLEPDEGGRRLTRDFASGRTELTFDWATGGLYRLVDAGVIAGCWATTYSIRPATRCRPRCAARPRPSWARDGWTTRAEVRAVMDADAERFRVRTELEAFENGESVRRREWSFETPRDLGAERACEPHRGRAPCPGTAPISASVRVSSRPCSSAPLAAPRWTRLDQAGVLGAHLVVEHPHLLDPGLVGALREEAVEPGRGAVGGDRPQRADREVRAARVHVELHRREEDVVLRRGHRVAHVVGSRVRVGVGVHRRELAEAQPDRLHPLPLARRSASRSPGGSAGSGSTRGSSRSRSSSSR